MQKTVYIESKKTLYKLRVMSHKCSFKNLFVRLDQPMYMCSHKPLIALFLWQLKLLMAAARVVKRTDFGIYRYWNLWLSQKKKKKCDSLSAVIYLLICCYLLIPPYCALHFLLFIVIWVHHPCISKVFVHMHFYDSGLSLLLNPYYSAQGTLQSVYMAIILSLWKPAKILLLIFSAFLEISGNTVVRKNKTD